LPVGRDHFNRGINPAANRHGVIFFAQMNDDLLDVARRRHLPEVIGISHNSISRSRSNQERITGIRVAIKLQRRAVEHGAGQELAIFKTFQILTRRFAVVLLHEVRIGNSCEPLT
jgi:hypothetical protein